MGDKESLDKDPITDENYLTKFAQSSCSPIILVPGVFGTKLSLKIKCQEALEKSPEKLKAIYKACKNDDNSGQQSNESCYSIPLKADQEEELPFFQIKKSGIMSSMAGSGYLDNFIKCAMEIFSLINIKKNRNTGHWEATDTPGFEVVPTYKGEDAADKNLIGDAVNEYMGFDKKGYLTNPSECRFRPTDKDWDFSGMEYEVFYPYYLNFKKMGYRANRTMNVFTYDWRLPVQQLYENGELEQMIEYHYKLTGKKVMIYTHSLGGLIAQATLAKMDKQKKQKMVANVVHASPFFNGDGSHLAELMGKNVIPEFPGDDLFYDKSKLLKYYKQSIQHMTLIYSSIYQNTYEKYKDKGWMKQIKRRIKYDQTGELDQDKLPFSWLPNIDCSENTDISGVDKETTKAQTGFYKIPFKAENPSWIIPKKD